MKKISFIISLMVIGLNSISQNAKVTEDYKNAVEVKNRILLVGLDEENPETIKNLSKKPKELENYKNQIEGNNMALKNAVDNYWKSSASVEYKPYSEATKLIDENPQKYALMYYDKYSDYTYYNTGYGANGRAAGWSGSGSSLSYNPSTHYSEASNVIMQIDFRINSTSVYANLPSLFVSKADAIYGVAQVQYVITALVQNPTLKLNDIYFKVVAQNAKELKNKTLLLDKEDLGKGVTEAVIKENYPYPFKIVSLEEIEKAIIDKQPGVAYVQITASIGAKGNVFIQYINNAEDGKILGVEYPKVAFGIKGIEGAIIYNQRIKEKQLERYAKIVEGK